MAESRQEESHDAVMVRIGQAIMLHRAGDREEARNRFAELWEETEGRGDLFHRCTIAHYMADTQESPAAELEWDERALAAADALTGEWALWGEHALQVRSLYPSLYLNLATDHAKLGDRPSARRELSRARAVTGDLPDDEYGKGIREAIERLELHLSEEPGPGTAPFG